MRQLRLGRIGAAFGLALLVCRAAVGQPHAAASGIVHIDVAGTQAVGSFDGVAYTRTWGVVHGRVAPGEAVIGLAALPKDAAGDYDYTAEFEIIAPAAEAAPNSTVFVEAENRGSPLFIDALNQVAAHGAPSSASYPAGVGNGFLFNHHIAYARVQWQTGIAAGVPDQAQGVGEVITRDFGRLLAKDPKLGGYKTRIIGGISQSAWFVNTFIAEGFNEDPATGHAVFNGAFAIDGTGNWMTINQLANRYGYKQYPYLNEAGEPLTPERLLKHPKSDPFYIDVANYTDFFRVRASVSRGAGFPTNMRRYDWPSPHAPGSAALFARGCNGGHVVPLDPISYFPYARALVLELVRQVGGASDAPALPPSTLFALAAPPSGTAQFNPLPGVALKVPALDDRGQPIGGVRFPEVEEPLARPLLPLPHVGLDSINDACGNALEWESYPAARLAALYGSKDVYLQRYAASLDHLIAQGFLLAADKPDMLRTAVGFYRAAAD
jgi:hypothetical protein